jgi:hypothetical protein
MARRPHVEPAPWPPALGRGSRIPDVDCRATRASWILDPRNRETAMPRPARNTVSLWFDIAAVQAARRG